MKITKKPQNKNLQLDDVTINNLQELREHPSTELLDVFKNGTLVKWLRLQEAQLQAEALTVLVLTNDDATDLVAICKILEIDIDIDDVRACFAELQEQAAIDIVDSYEENGVVLTKEEAFASLSQQFKDLSKKFQKVIKKTDDYIITRLVTSQSDDEDYDDDDITSIALLRNYKVVPDAELDSKGFDDHRMALIDEGMEFNCPDIGVPFVARDVDDFIVGSVCTDLFIVRAKNVFISDNYFFRSLNFLILAENVFIGDRFTTAKNSSDFTGFCVEPEDLVSNGIIVSKNVFMAPADYVRYEEIPFNVDLKTLQSHCVNGTENTRYMEKAFAAKGLRRPARKLDFTNANICAKHCIINNITTPKVLPPSWADELHAMLSDMLDAWFEKTSLFDPS